MVTASISNGPVPVPISGFPTASILISGVQDASFNGQFTIVSWIGFGAGIYQFTWDQVGLDSASAGGIFSTTQTAMRITMSVPDYYSDDGVGIDSKYIPAYAQDEQAVTILRFGGFRGQCGGNGTLYLTPITNRASLTFKTLKVILLPGEACDFERGLRIDNEYASIVYANNAVPGAWFLLQKHIMYAIPFQAGRRTN